MSIPFAPCGPKISTTLVATGLDAVDTQWRIVALGRSGGWLWQGQWSGAAKDALLRGYSVCTGRDDAGFVLYARIRPATMLEKKRRGRR